jgi:hypothetical protein
MDAGNPTADPMHPAVFSSTGSIPLFLANHLGDFTPANHAPLTILDSSRTFADGNVNAQAIHLSVSSFADVSGQVSAQVMFQTGQNGLLDLAVQGDASVAGLKDWRVTLKDVTTSTTLFDKFGSGLDPLGHSSYDTQIPLDSSHVYLLTDSAQGFEGDSASAKLDAGFASVPEGGTTISLLGLGFVGVVGLRRLLGITTLQPCAG